MRCMTLRNALSAAILIGGPIAAASALAQSQGGYGMMGGYGSGMMSGGGYGGILLPILLLVVIVGLVAWILARKRK